MRKNKKDHGNLSTYPVFLGHIEFEQAVENAAAEAKDANREAKRVANEKAKQGQRPNEVVYTTPAAVSPAMAIPPSAAAPSIPFRACEFCVNPTHCKLNGYCMPPKGAYNFFKGIVEDG